MQGLEKVLDGSRMLAIVIRNYINIDGPNNFFSEKDYPLQIGLHRCKKGHEFKPHVHKKFERTISGTQEVLYIKSGEVFVTFYGIDSKRVIGKSMLKAGDIVFLIEGGHGLRVVKDCVIFEVKQGPYTDREKDKEYI